MRHLLKAVTSFLHLDLLLLLESQVKEIAFCLALFKE